VQLEGGACIIQAPPLHFINAVIIQFDISAVKCS